MWDWYFDKTSTLQKEAWAFINLERTRYPKDRNEITTWVAKHAQNTENTNTILFYTKFAAYMAWTIIYLRWKDVFQVQGWISLKYFMLWKYNLFSFHLIKDNTMMMS